VLKEMDMIEDLVEFDFVAVGWRPTRARVLRALGVINDLW
jgi:hypothetical protein